MDQRQVWKEMEAEDAAAENDRLSTVISFGRHRTWKRLAAELLGDSAPERGGRALEVCCGTGDLAFLLSESEKFSVVVGVDNNEAMLQAAKVRSVARESQGQRAPLFIPGNALALPFADAELDAAAVFLGLYAAGAPERSLSELYRVMRPGALLAVIECCRPEGMPGSLAVKLQLSPAAGWIFGERVQERQMLRDYLAQAPAAGELRRTMEEAGFQNVRMRRFLFGGGVMLWGLKPKEAVGLGEVTCA